MVENKQLCISKVSIIVGVGLLTVVFSLLPISMIVIGAVYMNQCPAQTLIPIWLVVDGSVWVFNLLLIFVGFCLWATLIYNNKNIRHKWTMVVYYAIIISPVELFLFVWFIFGNIWVYGINSGIVISAAAQFTNSTSIYYCSKVVYDFAFWHITAGYVVAFVAILLFIAVVLPKCK